MNTKWLQGAISLSAPFLAALYLAFSQAPVAASVAYGSINNFDTVNDAGVECHGFEIEIEDLHSSDITYTYNWNHYGTPKITEDNSNPLKPRVRVRYESAKNADGSWAAYTAIPSGPIAPTDGHRFTDPTVNFGGEHFGVGYRGSPTNILYFWLIADGVGNLVRGPSVNVAAPTFVYIPPAAGGPAQVQAAIHAPDAPQPTEFGPPAWVKVIRTTAHNNGEIELRDLVSDDPDDPNDKNWRKGEPAEVETEWQLLQIEYRRDDGGRNAKLDGNPADLEQGDEIVTVRYEFYKYVGPIDPESGEAKADNVGPDGIHGIAEYADVVIVGDYIGSQMSAFDAELPIGLIEHLPDGEAGAEYPARSVVIAATPFVATITGEIPEGMTFDSETGVLSGVPNQSGIFSVQVSVSSEGHPDQSKLYILPIAAAGEQLPPHSIIELRSVPAEAGAPTGGGFCINGFTSTVYAAPAPGFGFSHWTENGEVVSRSVVYTFTNIVNRALVANFVPMPPLAFRVDQAGTLQLAWPTNSPGLFLQQTVSLDPVYWAPVTESVVAIDVNNVVTISPQTGARFFRLVRP